MPCYYGGISAAAGEDVKRRRGLIPGVCQEVKSGESEVEDY